MKRLIAMGGLVLALGAAMDARAFERRINTWLVCGTFESPDAAAFEQDPFDVSTLAPALGGEAGGKPWLLCDDRLYCRNLDDYVDLYTFFHPVRKGSPGEPTDLRAAYAHVYVWSPEDRDVEMRVGANDGYRVWVNGEPVQSKFELMSWLVRDGDRFPVSLKAGWNRLLLKIQNGRGIWGFYANLVSPEGAPLEGLEYSVDAPEGDLRITTDALPAAYESLHYVALEVQAPPEDCVPSASPFRLSAAGGTPPYEWKVAADTRLPAGLTLNGLEGELWGVAAAPVGPAPVRVYVRDAEGNQASASFTLDVRERPTKWMEEVRLGGLIHGSPGYELPHGDPVEQAKLMAHEGYGFAYQTTGWLVLPKDWPGGFDMEMFKGSSDFVEKFGGQISQHQDVSAYARAFRERGIRFGSYVGLPDNVGYVFKSEEDYKYWPAYLDALHNHLQNLCVEYQVAALYLDGASQPFQGKYDWNFDAQYSIVKTVTPECLLIPNLTGDAEGGHRVGDADVMSVEGNNDADPYWTRWPNHHSSRNPKYMAVATWRYPFSWEMWKGTERENWRKPGTPYSYQDPQEWLRVVISLVGEGYICDLDHSFGFGREEMHRQIGDWLQPRLKSVVGTWPGPLEDGDWGYDVVSGDTLYLHILENPRGKVGLQGRSSLEVGPVEGVTAVTLLPDGKALEFRQEGDRLVINTQGIEPDPVSTVVAIQREQ